LTAKLEAQLPQPRTRCSLPPHNTTYNNHNNHNHIDHVDHIHYIDRIDRINRPYGHHHTAALSLSTAAHRPTQSRTADTDVRTPPPHTVADESLSAGAMAKKQRMKKPMGKTIASDGSRNYGMGVTVEQSGVPQPDGWSAASGRADGLERTPAGLVSAAAMCPASVPAGLSRADFTVGTKVVRGPAWCGGRRMYNDQDGGEGQLGMVVDLPPQLACKPEHADGQWVAVQWRATNILGTYRAGGVGHEGVFDIVPWESDPKVEAIGASSLLDLCDGYQQRRLTKSQFKQGLRETGCPDDALDSVVAMVEAKGMAPAPQGASQGGASHSSRRSKPSKSEQLQRRIAMLEAPATPKTPPKSKPKAEPAVTPPVSPERARLRNAVLEVTRENPGMGVKKMVALIKQHSPELSSVGAKEVRQMIAVLNQ